MEVIINLLKNHWELIVSVLLFILSFILQLFKKKPLNALGLYIQEWCIEGIDIAENSGVKGKEKLAIAVQYVLNRLKRNFPDIDVESYRTNIIDFIEILLSTPQKK